MTISVSAEVIRLAGFSSTTTSILVRRETKRWLVALIDTNGDGRLIEMDSFWKDGQGRWLPGIAVGAGVAGEGELEEGVSYR